MPAYMIISIEEISDPDRYKSYISQVSSIVQEHGGRYLARGGEIVSFAGGWDPKRVILIEFDNIQQARACFDSAEYKKVAPLREGSTLCRALFVEGVQTQV